ncbi:MAG TPA: patatin-like phospholipase family protein [Gaiellales bacterium]|nr:patatin-like phospholipase family protein [Gaiellales bacterium]
MADGGWNTTADGTVVHEADAVFEGGGVKGVALVGALEEFAAHGYTTWRNVAGTSAGAILASYIACGHSAEEAMAVVAEAPYHDFEDWGRGGEILGGGLNLIREHGLCHGEAFRVWLDGMLEGKTFADVRNEDGSTRLKMIATDITRQKMLVLPEDLVDYRDRATGRPIDAQTFKIADAVRMSMSIPYFFAPVHMISAEDGHDCQVVDGGVLSNFPVWLFDASPDRSPTRPTFGFRITGGRGVGSGLDRVINALGWPVQMGSAIFHTATGAWDTRFASHSTVVRTCPVPAGHLGTTDFDRVNAVKDQVVKGARAAAMTFVEQFKLADYRNTYAQKVQA